jgi:glutamate racemase
VLGVVIPLAEAGIQASRYGRIGVIGTRATIESAVYEQELGKLRRSLKVYGLACPLLVPLVEEGWIGKPETNSILKKYLRYFKDRKVDTLLLGCTHYPFLQKDIERIMGKTCKVPDAPEIVADKLKDYLHRHPEIDNRIMKNGKRTFFTTDDPGRFRLLGEKFLGQRIQEVEKLTLE